MKDHPKLTLNQIGARWAMNRVTVRRVLVSHGWRGIKFGHGKTASVRYDLREVEEVERRASGNKKIALLRREKDFPNQTLKRIAKRWNVHFTTASAILQRYGRQAFKFGEGRSASVRFTLDDLEEVERLAAMDPLATIGLDTGHSDVSSPPNCAFV